LEVDGGKSEATNGHVLQFGQLLGARKTKAPPACAARGFGLFEWLLLFSLLIPMGQAVHIRCQQVHFVVALQLLLSRHLARVGGRYSDDWQRAHLYNPRNVVPESKMPAYPWLVTAAVDSSHTETKLNVMRWVTGWLLRMIVQSARLSRVVGRSGLLFSLIL
jgi:hypothetical protein